MKKLQVNTSQKDYTIHIANVLDKKNLLNQFIDNRQVMIVTNDTVDKLYLENMVTVCSTASDIATCILPDGERFKSLVSIESIYNELLSHNFNRDCVVIALGGGVIGDMAGFAAASYQRGVSFIQVPTTLLSQVDSSVGGKTGVNHTLGKNMIGAFKQPEVVIIETTTLKTLPKREVSAGIAEIIKYALINDYDFFCWLEQNIDKLVNLEDNTVSEAIYRSCQHKAKIVAEDEFESGRRALLNFGHTFGHVIENYMGYGNWLHGEAVSVGMLQASFMSEKLGWISTSDVLRIKKLLVAAGLPINPPDLPVNDALKLMSRDKKVKSGKVRLILLKAIGKAIITDDFDFEVLKETLSQKSI